MSFAQELTADSVAVQDPWYAAKLAELLDWLIGFIFTGLFFYFSGGYTAIRKWVATTKHGQEIGILMDALKLAISNMAKKKGKHYGEIVADLVRIVSDLSITSDEKIQLIAMRDEIKADAIAIAHESFKQLRGWAKDKGVSWIAERIDLFLGELESRLFDLKEN